GQHVLDNLPEGAFVTVSNHPFGAIDGIALIGLVGSRRPDFKVMVNMILNHIGGLRQNFIAVDALASDDPEKRRVSVNGIRECIKQVRNGHPVGFFPAGAVSKVNRRLQLEDRPWQQSVIRIIRQTRVPVIPIYFHGSNSWWFNFLGIVSWQLRTLRLPAEVFNKNHKPIYISVGDPISPDTIATFGDDDVALGKFLKAQTYKLRDRRKKQ
ncbi:MAG: lysophospholipid acyltransferase family protein, partial [Muribaculum sp.]|nr:lysophospholipid acyltransferase family protein [Muribaculum sp.]